MKKKDKDEDGGVFDPEQINRSALLHEFFHLYNDFHEEVSQKAAKNLCAFLLDKQKLKGLLPLARFNPHPETHESFELDCEAAVIALNSWIDGKVDAEVPDQFVHDLKYWLSSDRD